MKTKFQKGDWIHVITGKYRGTMGVITEVKQHLGRSLYSFEALNGELFENALSYELEKTVFKKGEDVSYLAIDLEMAKQLYQAGGVCKELALKAFSETKLRPRVQSWDQVPQEFQDCVQNMKNAGNAGMKQLIAQYKLQILRNLWVGDWNPIYDMNHVCWYVELEYRVEQGSLIPSVRTGQTRQIPHQYTFPTAEMAVNFAKTFKETLLESSIA